jgi:hypothetical protein
MFTRFEKLFLFVFIKVGLRHFGAELIDGSLVIDLVFRDGFKNLMDQSTVKLLAGSWSRRSVHNKALIDSLWTGIG